MYKRQCIIEQKRSNAARSSPEFVHLGRCAHTAVVVDPEPDHLNGELGLPGRLFPAAGAAAAAAAAAPAAAAAAAAAAALMLAPVPCALKSTDLLRGCCCYVAPAVG